MSIKIHHGPGGTYKTSGAIKDDILKVIEQGRTLVTNVRGFSKEKAIKVLGKDKVHPDWEVIYIDTDLSVNRQKMARFFHWAPKGAYICIDEVQRIWNPKLTAKEMKAFDYPNGAEAAEKDDRPEDIYAAFDMHRHHNWDFSLTTTNIKKVHPVLKENTEMAYRHVNMAVIGIKGRYKEITHDKENNGTSASNQISVKNKKIPSYIFELYESTKTGEVSDSIAGTSIFKDPKIAGMLLFVVAIWTYLLVFADAPNAVSMGKNKDVATAEKGAPLATGESAVSGVNSNSGDKGDRVQRAVVDGDGGGLMFDVSAMPYLSRFDDIWVTGAVLSTGRNQSIYMFAGTINQAEYHFNSDDLVLMGFKVLRKTACLVDLVYQDQIQSVFCGLNKTKAAFYSTNSAPQATSGFE